MATKQLELEIVSPEKMLFNGAVSKVHVPGSKAPFTVLPGHAPLVSVLCQGYVVWEAAAQEHKVGIKGGFVEVKDDRVIICTET